MTNEKCLISLIMADKRKTKFNRSHVIKKKINLVTVGAINPEVLYHFLKHYSEFVDDIFFNLWGSSEEIEIDYILEVLDKFNLKLHRDERDNHSWNESFKENLCLIKQ